MKSPFLITLFVLSFGSMGFAQEFKTFKNQLIYNEETMQQLEEIVDSLNLKYKYCELNKTYKTKSQTIGYTISLKNDVEKAKRDLENGMNLADFQANYPSAKVDSSRLIVRFDYTRYDGQEVVSFSAIDFGKGYNKEILFEENLETYRGALKEEWIINERNNRLSAFYIPNGFVSKPLPEKYARMIGYGDCLIDTTVTKMKEDAAYGNVTLPKKWRKLPKEEQREWLDSLRSTRVTGICSMDASPRYHARDIALVAAETAEWEVFLRAHLDIMNDRFDRMSDGSYAYAQRQTYIRELEELNIDVPSLIMGISFRVENPGDNHYYGSINRLGRALSETKDPLLIEDLMLSAMKDGELDWYNRILVCFLYRNYSYYLTDEERKTESLNRLREVISSLPADFRDQIILEDEG